MSLLVFLVISLLLFVSDCNGAISDKRLCGDPTCSEPVSLGTTLIRYVADDARILSFHANVPVQVFSKSAGSRPDLWGVEISGNRGYAPKSFIKETKILKGKLEHSLSTSEEASDAVIETPTLLHSVDENVDVNSEDAANMKELPAAGFKEGLLSPNIDASADKTENAVTSSETQEPYEVVDGTTFLFSTDSLMEPSPIQATTIDTNIRPTTIQSQLETGSKTETLDEPRPNPSLTLPNAATSADANVEKQDTEGSAEKIYNYLISNFMSEEGGGELVSGEKEELPSSESINKAEEVLVKSTASIPEPSTGIVLESDTTLEQNDASIPPASMDINVSSGAGEVEKLAPPENIEVDNSISNDNPNHYINTSSFDSGLKDKGDQINASSLVGKESKKEVPQMLIENSEEEYGDDEDEDEDEDDDVEDEDMDISGEEEEYKSREEKASTDSVQPSLDTTVHTASTPSHLPDHMDLDDPLKKEQIAKDMREVINDSNIEFVGTKKTEETEVSHGHVSEVPVSGNATLEATEPQAKDLVGNLGTQTVDLHSLAANEPNANEINNNLKSFETHVQADSNVDSISQESTVGQHVTHIPSNVNLDPNVDLPITKSTDKLEDNFGRMVLEIAEDQDILLKNNLNSGNDMIKEINSSDQTLDSPPNTGSDLENKVDKIAESSVDQNISHESNDTDTNEDKATPVEPELENMLNSTSEELSIPVTEGFDNVVDIAEDTLITQSPSDESTEDLYIATSGEDSSLNVVTEAPATLTEPSLDDVESSGGFFSGLVGSLFGNFFSDSETTDVEVGEVDEQENLKEIDEHEVTNGDLSLAQRFFLNHGKQPTPESSSTCSAESGNDPDCDNVLFAGKEPSVSDDEAAILQTMEEQEQKIPIVELWESGSAYGMISYLAITAISMVVIILGHWFIEKTRCDSTFIKRINDLERALLYAELESQNLKADLDETRGKVPGSKDIDSVKALEEQLQAALETTISLEEKNESLEEKNAGLQVSLDAATEAGLELNRMLSDILSTNKGSESLILSVNDLQHQLNSQQATINNMNSVLSSKEAESESLRHNLSSAHDTIQSLERELNQLTESLHELLEEKSTQEDHLKSMKIELESQLKTKSTREEKLSEEVGALRRNILEMESERITCDVETALLRECVTRLKDDRSGNDEEFKMLFDVAKAEASCRELLVERNRLAEELEGERDARKLLADHVDITTIEVQMLRNAVEQSEKEKQEALTKHAVLADYFKDKESQLHKELGYRDALYMQTKGDATSTHEEVKTLHEQLESYKSQIDTLKSEIVDQERGLKSQILAFEKKAHENWLAARQAERKLQESKLEASQLRNRLTVVEKNTSNAVNSEVSLVDRDSMDLNCVSPSSPPLYPLDSNTMPTDNGALPTGRLQLVPPPHSVLNHPLDETLHHGRSNHASPSLNSRLQPVHKSPANVNIMFRVEEAHDPQSPFYGILSPSAPFDPFHGRPVQDRHDPDLYHIVPLLPYLSGPPPLILPPPVLPNIPGTRDRRPPPLGRMSSPPVGGRMSPPPPRGHKASPLHGRMGSPFKHSTAHSPERRRRRSSPLSDRILSPPPSLVKRSPSPDRGRRRSPQRVARRHGSRTPERERRRSVDSTSQGRVSPAPRGRTPSPGRGRPYRRQSRSPSPYSSAGSTPESRRHHARRFDFSPDGSYRGRSRTPSPSGFRPISRHANQGSNHSYESDESNRRSGRP